MSKAVVQLYLNSSSLCPEVCPEINLRSERLGQSRKSGFPGLECRTLTELRPKGPPPSPDLLKTLGQEQRKSRVTRSMSEPTTVPSAHPIGSLYDVWHLDRQTDAAVDKKGRAYTFRGP